MIQNCRVHRSAQFLNTDHRPVVATLKLHLKSGRMVPSQPRLYVGKLKDERVAEEFANMLNGDLGGLGALEVLKSCGVPSRPPYLMLPVDILDLTEGRRRILSLKRHWIPLPSHRARLNRRAELFRELRRQTVCALRVDKEAYMRGICEGVEHHLWSSDSRPAYRGIRTLRLSKPVPRCTAVRAEGGGLLTEESEVKARWAIYFEQLYQADPPSVELDVRGVTIPVADPPINCGHLRLWGNRLR